MNTHSLRLAVALTAALVPGVAVAQHDVHEAGTSLASADLVQCARMQPAVDNIIAAAMTRLESARQSNSPAQMRAAVDQLEAALRDIRTQLAPCATAAATADPHAGHTMPGMPPASSAPAPSNPSPASTPDPHADHAMPAPPAAPKSAPASRPATTRAPSQSTTDPHAGHTMPAAPAAPKAGSPSKAMPSTPERPQAADSHAGHGSAQPSDKQMDPVNGLMVDPATSPTTNYQGQTYYFSSEQSRKEFLENPAKFAKKTKE